MKNLADQSASIETPTTEHPRNLEQLWLSMFDLEASEGILEVDSLDEGVPSRARLGKSFFVHTCQ